MMMMRWREPKWLRRERVWVGWVVICIKLMHTEAIPNSSTGNGYLDLNNLQPLLLPCTPSFLARCDGARVTCPIQHVEPLTRPVILATGVARDATMFIERFLAAEARDESRFPRLIETARWDRPGWKKRANCLFSLESCEISRRLQSTN